MIYMWRLFNENCLGMNFGRNFDCQSKQKDTLYVEIVFLFLITSKLASNLNPSAAHDVKFKRM